MRKELARMILKWFENTMVDPDVIMNHFAVPRKGREDLRQIAKDIRERQWQKSH